MATRRITARPTELLDLGPAPQNARLAGDQLGSQTGANVYGNTPDDCYVEP